MQISAIKVNPIPRNFLMISLFSVGLRRLDVQTGSPTSSSVHPFERFLKANSTTLVQYAQDAKMQRVY
ncbi:hypothetical protein EUGRSUZ_F00231 [Eucalyptus grandis]|uniref:Uncharacterized protein n=2 Tax=Eucalyptus grandis TaxID=71139 RepID=A0ACC3K9T7_EUCGR|nr:hypothetical protein EUGRSUZ_F00231 [Eucalyptus grandis]